MRKTKRYYFTFGEDSPDQPYKDGWVIVVAKNINDAQWKFCRKYPKVMGMIPCNQYYSEKVFMETEMYKNNINCGASLQGVIL